MQTIAAQTKRIQEVEFLIDNLFSKMVFEEIRLSDTNRVATFSDATGHSAVFIKLEFAPIFQSLQLTVRPGDGLMIPHPFHPTQVMQNVTRCNLYQFAAPTTVVSVQYVKDTRSTNLVKTLEMRGDVLWVDGARSVKVSQ